MGFIGIGSMGSAHATMAGSGKLQGGCVWRRSAALPPPASAVHGEKIPALRAMSTGKNWWQTPVKLSLNGRDFDDLLGSLIRMSHGKHNDPDSKYNTTYHQRWQVRW